MIAFDLDGVFIPDGNMQLYTKSSYLQVRKKFPRALFVPDCEYAIITGRPVEDMPYTLEWIKNELYSNMPKCVYHTNEDITKGEVYKTHILNTTPGIEMFVESCPKQAAYIKANLEVPIKVIHFEEFILEALRGLRNL